MYCPILSEHIFALNGGWCVYYPSNIFCNKQVENWEILLGYSPVSVWVHCIFSHVVHLDQLYVRKIFDGLYALYCRTAYFNTLQRVISLLPSKKVTDDSSR